MSLTIELNEEETRELLAHLALKDESILARRKIANLIAKKVADQM